MIHPKVKAAGGAGALATVLIWVAQVAGVELPAEVAAAMATLVGVGAGFAKAS